MGGSEEGVKWEVGSWKWEVLQIIAFRQFLNLFWRSYDINYLYRRHQRLLLRRRLLYLSDGCYSFRYLTKSRESLSVRVSFAAKIK